MKPGKRLQQSDLPENVRAIPEVKAHYEQGGYLTETYSVDQLGNLNVRYEFSHLPQ